MTMTRSLLIVGLVIIFLLSFSQAEISKSHIKQQDTSTIPTQEEVFVQIHAIPVIHCLFALVGELDILTKFYLNLFSILIAIRAGGTHSKSTSRNGSRAS